LTDKPFIYVFNVDEATLGDQERRSELEASVAPAPCVILCAKVEAELAGLDPAERWNCFSPLARKSRVCHNFLGWVRDPGPADLSNRWSKETRAWTIRRGETAPEAAGEIHTDFQKHFIKAEVVAFDDLMAAGSMVAVRAAEKPVSRARTTSCATATWWSSASTPDATMHLGGRDRGRRLKATTNIKEHHDLCNFRLQSR